LPICYHLGQAEITTFGSPPSPPLSVMVSSKFSKRLAKKSGKRKSSDENPAEPVVPLSSPLVASIGSMNLQPILIGSDDIQVSDLLAATTIGAPRETTPSSFSPAVGASSSNLPPPLPSSPIEVAVDEQPGPSVPTSSAPVRLHFAPGPELSHVKLPNDLLKGPSLNLDAHLSYEGPNGSVTHQIDLRELVC